MTTDRAPKEAKDQKNRRQDVQTSENAFQSEAAAPLRPDHANILHLQRTIGNQAVQRLAERGELTPPGQAHIQTSISPRIQRWEGEEHRAIGDEAAGGPAEGRIILESHRRDLPQREKPVHTWPPEWQELFFKGSNEQKNALKKGLSYGEILALTGDLYAGFAQLNTAPLQEIYTLIPLMHRKAGTLELEKASGGRFLDLASKNEDHFSNVPIGHRNIDRWRNMHSEAIQAARHGDANLAWGINAGADHFLTDAFSGGHIRTPRTDLSKPGGLVAKSLHDDDNEHGVEVINAAGDKWTAYGDNMLDDSRNAKNREMVKRAVELSKQDVSDALAQGKAYPTPDAKTVFPAELLVPQPVDPSQTPGNAIASSFRDDDQIRQWIANHDLAALSAQPASVKIQMINTLMDGWVSADDMNVIIQICHSVTSAAEMAQIRAAIEPRVTSLTSFSQRVQLQLALSSSPDTPGAPPAADVAPPIPAIPERLYYRFDRPRGGDSLEVAVRADQDLTPIRELAVWMQRVQGVEIVLEGHASSEGAEYVNEGVALERAEAVERFLFHNGADLENNRVTTISHGETGAKGGREWRYVQISVRGTPVAKQSGQTHGSSGEW